MPNNDGTGPYSLKYGRGRHSRARGNRTGCGYGRGYGYRNWNWNGNGNGYGYGYGYGYGGLGAGNGNGNWNGNGNGYGYGYGFGQANNNKWFCWRRSGLVNVNAMSQEEQIKALETAKKLIENDLEMLNKRKEEIEGEIKKSKETSAKKQE